jgi:hypothetical protein
VYLLLRVCGWFDLLSEDSHVVQCVCGERRREDVQGGTVFGVKGGVEGFGQDVCCVVCGGHAPNSHIALHVILFDFVVSYVYRSRVF